MHKKMILFWVWCVLFSRHIHAQLAPTDDPCDCGYYDPHSPGVWTNGWTMDFGNELAMNTAWTHTTIRRLEQDFFMASYEISAKYKDTYSRVFSMDNVRVTSDTLQLGVTVDQKVTCAAIGTKRSDILYGSFRSQMRLTPVNGTVQAMYFYNPDGEIDIEVLGAVAPPQAYFALHPGLQEPNGRASALTHDNHLLAFDPTLDFHDYRFDWYADRADFYIDTVLAKTLVTHVPNTPGRFMFSHWTDGNVNFSKGPPLQDAVMEIKSVVALFNTSVPGTLPCQRTQQACNINDLLNGQASPSASPIVTSPAESQPPASAANKLSKSFLVGLLLLLGCTVILS